MCPATSSGFDGALPHRRRRLPAALQPHRDRERRSGHRATTLIGTQRCVEATMEARHWQRAKAGSSSSILATSNSVVSLIAPRRYSDPKRFT
jgi:hypothetical protein